MSDKKLRIVHIVAGAVISVALAVAAAAVADQKGGEEETQPRR
jgi:predicted protein tyrosine phosphatase